MTLICQACYSTYDEEYRSKECPHESLPQTDEERVKALEKALAAQDSVHKLDIRAIALSIRRILWEYYPETKLAEIERMEELEKRNQ